MHPGPKILGTSRTLEQTADFGAFAAALKLEDIPDAALAQARRTFLDTLGTAIGGSSLEAARLVAGTAGTKGWRTVIGGGDPSTAEMSASAFALATSASALDFDDGHYLGGAIHPGSVVVPAVFVAAAGRQVSLDEMVTAQVAGYEVGLRLAHLLWPRHEQDRYHCTGTAACVAGAVAAARLRGADAELMTRTIEIAWSYAPMAALQFPMVKEAIGWSCATAMYAVRLAEDGFKALPSGARRPAVPDVFPPTPFDEPAAVGDPFLATLGEVFESGRTYLKPYSCCRYTHTAARTLSELIGDGLEAAEVKAISVGTHKGAVFLSERRPPTLEHAQYSFPFVLGAIASDGDAGPEQISAERLADPAILDFAALVSVHHDREMDRHFPEHYASSLTVTLSDGSQVRTERRVAPGDPAEPLTETEIETKFGRLITPLLGAHTTKSLLDVLLDPSGRGIDELRGVLAGSCPR
ncbi:MAG TPA: MmgE/PrpD family protein [Solirubrobacterales bacterium]|nr:MmgE/PrpD family protein [Solirubrobacterales bacterium]